jgi:cell division protein FtsZ
VSLKGAKAVLVNVTGGLDMTLLEVDEAANAISEQVDPEANIIFGAAFDPSLDGMIRVSVVATGMDGASIAAIEPKIERRPNAPPLRADTSRALPQAAPEPQRSTYAAAPAPQSAPQPLYRAEPALQAEPLEEEQPDLYAAAVAQAPAPAEPRITRIVDPAVAEADDDEPLFTEPAYAERRPRGGFLSLFGGRPRYEAPPAPVHSPAPAPRASASRGGALPAEAPAPIEEAEPGEDLEIPSFLRRLAN